MKKLRRASALVLALTHSLQQALLQPRIAGGIVLTVLLVATLQKYLLGAEQMNNLLIFRTSAWHLLSNTNLYALSPADHADLFKYSPTFALCMLPFAALPLVWSAVAWNMLNGAVFVVGVYAASRLLHRTNTDGQHSTDWQHTTDWQRTFAIMLWICAVELLTSVQNFQSNALMAGLALCTLVAMERGKTVQAALYLALSLHIKIYGVAPIALMLFYPQKTHFTLAFVGFVVLLTAAPLLAVAPETLVWQYQNWRALLQSDHAASYGLSVMSILLPLLPNVQAVSAVQAISLLVQCAPVVVFALRPRLNMLTVRLLCGASMLLWMVIFNHKAESPTFIIAVSGVALWYEMTRGVRVEDTDKNVRATKGMFVMQRVRQTWLRNGLLWLVIIGTSLSVTDLFPETLRNGIFASVHLKVLPCIAVWLYLQAQLWQWIITPDSTTGTQFER
jgi:hypothetical protein